MPGDCVKVKKSTDDGSSTNPFVFNSEDGKAFL